MWQSSFPTMKKQEISMEELAQMGIECEPIRLDSYTKKKMTFFFDPDGLPLELHE